MRMCCLVVVILFCGVSCTREEDAEQAVPEGKLSIAIPEGAVLFPLTLSVEEGGEQVQRKIHRSWANDVNAKRHVVGSCAPESDDRAYVWDPIAGTVELLPMMPSYKRMVARAISDNDVICGFAQKVVRPIEGFIWDRSTKTLHTLGVNSAVHDISRDGTVVVGVVYDEDNDPHACVWERSAQGWQRIALPSTFAGEFGPTTYPCEAAAVSPNGNMVVGKLDTRKFPQPYLWKRTASGWEGEFVGTKSGDPNDVADDGTVVGHLGFSEGCAWTNGMTQRFSMSAPFENSEAIKVCDKGIVVYFYSEDQEDGLAVLWDEEWGVPYFSQRAEIHSANAQGDIVGDFFDPVRSNAFAFFFPRK